MILLIDNYDSFTYNLYQLVGALGYNVRVVYHDKISLEEIENLKPDKIILSPGPKAPCSAGICLQLIQHFFTRVPILGICLGHQCLGVAFGSEVQSAKRLIHGQTTKIYHDKSQILKSLPYPFLAARYHSLALNSVPQGFVKSAWDKNDEIMAIEHKQFPLYGIQFHPESFMTDHGQQIMKNFLNA